MIIDVHGHYTTAPKKLWDYRDAQKTALKEQRLLSSIPRKDISDDEIRESLQGQLTFQKDRGTDVTIFSPRASAQEHHIGTEEMGILWAQYCNDMIYRATQLYPQSFVGVCQLPQSPGISLANAISELERCVNDLGFVGLNLNPDPSGGRRSESALTSERWYPLYRKMVELRVPAMIHTSGSCDPINYDAVTDDYLSADTVAFGQLLRGGKQLFSDFPTLQFIIPHGGGAVPYQWDKYRGRAQDQKGWMNPEDLLANVSFDTCVYGQRGMDLLLDTIPARYILFASEMIGAVRGKDPNTGHYFDDTKKYIDATKISEEDRRKIFETNAFRVIPRLEAVLKRAT